MSSRKKRSTEGPGLTRALWLMSVVFAFAGSAVLLTCQPNTPGKRITQQTPSPQPERDVRHPSTTQDSAQDSADAETPAPVRPDVDVEPPASSELPPAPPQPSVQLPSRPPEPPPTPQTAVVGGEVSRGDPNSRRIALTFDAGWEFKPVDDILEALARHNVRATFFLTGRWVEKNPELTRRIAAEGHEIGNHTYSHRRLTELSDGEIAKEAERTEQLVLKTAGLSTEPLLRVPYGDRNKRVLSVLKEQGYQSIFWDVDSWDGYKKGITSAEIERRVLTKTRNGSIVLMHCGSQATADALDSILQKLTDAGYEPVTVSELLGA